MNETSEQLFVKSSSPSESENTGALTAGDLLRQAREAQHIELATLAAVLKVSESKLRALEANDFSHLPEMAFVRGLAKSVCKRLEIDENPVLDLLPALHGSQALRLSMDLSARQHATVIKKERYKGSKRSKLWWIIPVILVMVLLVLFTGPDRWRKALFSRGESSQNSSTQILTDEQNTGGATRTVQIPRLDTYQGADSSFYDDPSVPIDASAGEQTGGGDANQSGTESVQNVPDTQSTVQAPAITQELRFTATGSTSITVKNRDDKVLLTRTLKKDEEVSIPLENLPLKVNVGNVKATTVQLRGETFDLKPYTKRNTANFEVK